MNTDHVPMIINIHYE